MRRYNNLPDKDTTSNNRRIAKNTVFLYFRMLFLMFLGFYSSRVTLKVLGQEDFGIYNLVAGVIVMFQFLNASLTSAMQRYLNFTLGENDPNGAKKVFSICMKIYITLALILVVLCESIGLFILNYYLKIPTDRMKAANIVFHISSLTMVINMLRIPFHSAIITTERMSFFAYISIIEGVLKLAILFILTIGQFDKLVLYASLMLSISIIMLVIFFLYCKKNISFINFTKYKDSELVKSIMSFSGWNVFGSFASVAVNQGINIFINRFYGVLLNAAMAAATQASNAVTSFLNNFQTAFHPQLVKSYAKQDMEFIYGFSYKVSKYSFFLMYFIILPFSVNLKYVLSIWLTTVPEMTAEFITVMLFIALIDSLADPFFMLAMAEGNIKVYQIVGSLSMLMILPVAYILLAVGLPAYWALVVKLVQGILFCIYRLLYLRKRINLPVKVFFRTILSRVLVIIVFSYPLLCIIHNVLEPFGQLPQLLISCVASCVILIILYWFIGIDKNERNVFKEFVRKKITKK